MERLDPRRHARDLFDANAGHDALWDYMGYGPFASFDAYRAWQAEMAALHDPVFYALRDSATGRVGGVASFLRIDRANGVIEIGHIQIAPRLQHSTAASEFIMAMIRWAFGAGFRRVEWKCNDQNRASMRAAARYGFVYEGTFRNHMLVKGRNRDTAWLSIIAEDWPQIDTLHRAWLAADNFDETGQQRRSLDQIRQDLAG